MKRFFKLTAFLTLLSSLIFYACKKHDVFLSTTQSEFDIKEAKEWWYGTFKKTTSFNNINYTNPLASKSSTSKKVESTNNSLHRLPSWKRGFSYKIGSYQVVELPLISDYNAVLLLGMQKAKFIDKQRVAESALKKVLLIKKPNGTVVVKTFSLIPTLEYAKQNNFDITHNSANSLDPSFSGYMLIQNWDGSIVNAIKVENGKFKRKVQFTQRANLKLGVTSNNIQMMSTDGSGGGDECGYVWTPKLYKSCAVASSGDEPIDDENCEWVESPTEGSYDYVPCETDNSDTDPFLSCLNSGNSLRDCWCQVFGICEGDDGSGDSTSGGISIGSGTGTGGASSFDQTWLNGLKDSTNNPCVDKTLDTLASISNTLPELIRDFFGSNASFNMTFKQSFNDVWGNNGNAPEGAHTTENIDNNNFQVNINSYYGNITDLGLAATIIHEALHCQFLDWYREACRNNDITKQQELAEQYGYLFGGGITEQMFCTIVNNGNPSQHQDMVMKYQNQVANALYQFAKANNINVDINYCIDLAWTGTLDSKAFKDLSYSAQQRIMNRIGAEKDPYSNLSDPSGNYSVNGENRSSKGHPCN